MPVPIEDYALIGDCETAALVSRQGSIDWLCWPHFGSPACFAALVGTEENGHWSIAPKGPARCSRRYLDHTLVLETTFETGDGWAVLLDFMPLRERNPDVVRIVRGLKGNVAMSMELVLRFDYGHTVPWVTRMDDGALRAIAGPDMAVFRTSAPIRGEDLKTVADFTIHEGESATFVLTYGPSYNEIPQCVEPEAALRDTINFWQDWTSRAQLHGEYANEVERSLITLKALTYRYTGGIVAAPTTSLPEWLGSQRNWDYRYCWLRDATFTLLALMNAGYYEEARDWRDWLLRAVAGSPDQVQIMYGIRGERNLLEWEVPWLSGYGGSKPVRIGNAASEQLQLDVYGEIADALLHAHLASIPPSDDELNLHSALNAHLEQIWQEPDEGIWEIRGEPQHFTYSKMMAWVAFDRSVKASEVYHLKAAELNRCRELRDRIHRDVCEKAFNAQLGTFTQSYGSDQLDASLLLIPQVGFLPCSDPRVRATIEAIEKRLTVDGFVLRYRTEHVDDGLPAGEGVFLACSFWMVSALKMLGRSDDAKRLFDRLISLRNDVGLLAEEYDPRGKRQLGNFPQALSHISLINAAFEFNRAASPGQQRAESATAQPARR
ncbi:MAG TPA: glycoside hydrolase family 15 protein [Terriglobales bacterium]|nr:glycoside hydrolase family 15 protein [Terriglobales bacterium]